MSLEIDHFRDLGGRWGPGASETLEKVAGFAPHLLEVYPTPQGPPGPPK